MNSRNLQYFLTVANEHSISVAAKKLYVSQPSLSEAIKRIEEQGGAPLFKRTQKGLALTDTGRQFYAAASQTQKIWQDFYLNLNASDEMRISRLSFGVTTQLGLKVLPNILLNFNKQFPLVDCNIEDIRHRELEQKLLVGYFLEFRDNILVHRSTLQFHADIGTCIIPQYFRIDVIP